MVDDTSRVCRCRSIVTRWPLCEGDRRAEGMLPARVTSVSRWRTPCTWSESDGHASHPETTFTWTGHATPVEQVRRVALPTSHWLAHGR